MTRHTLHTNWTALVALAALAALSVGCSDKDSGGGDDTGTSAADDTSGGDDTSEGGVEAVCTEPTDIPCTDAIISDLSLQDDKITEGEVTTTTEGDDFFTLVDATAGGYGRETRNAWTYVKFTETGAEKVEIDDETALESMDWDLAARRFILRLNGGDSGPSCVGAAALLESEYEDLTEVPDGLSYQMDDYYTDDCTLTNDSSGLPGSPQVALGPWWEYPGCVATTGVPFFVQLADGHVIKLRVETYYEEKQDTCNETGSSDMDAGGYIRMRWRMLQ